MDKIYQELSIYEQLYRFLLGHGSDGTICAGKQTIVG